MKRERYTDASAISISYVEIVSIFIRKFNSGRIDRLAFETVKSALRSELINDPNFSLLSIDDTAFYNGIALMEAYDINSTDAALLVLFQSFIKTFKTESDTVFLLVASDERLVRTSESVGNESCQSGGVACVGGSLFSHLPVSIDLPEEASPHFPTKPTPLLRFT